MSTNDSSQRSRRSRSRDYDRVRHSSERPREGRRPRDEERRHSTSQRNRADARERERRRATRRRKTQPNAIGADSLATPAAQAFGLAGRLQQTPRGRGETARRVERDRAESIAARPAVYTEKPKSWLASLRLPSLSVPTVALVAVVVALMLAILWVPSRSYYAAWRERGLLEAEYEALVQQNGELEHDLERLQTLEGIEDEARSRGYVYPGEEALVVDGLEEERQTDPVLIEQAIEEYEANLPWYVPLLDVVFGYSRE